MNIEYEISSSRLNDFLKTGKIENDFEIHENYVVGICLAYADRAVEKNEYIISEKSVIEIADNGLSYCVQYAKQLAFESVARILFTEHYEETHDTVTISKMPRKSSKSEISKAVPIKSEIKESLNDLPESERVSNDTDDSEKNTHSVENEDSMGEKHATQVTLDDLAPVTSLVVQNQPKYSNSCDDKFVSDADYDKALQTPITICGKHHDMFKKTVETILKECPELIVFLLEKDYPATPMEEKRAIKLVYNEALRNIQKSA